jgi:hypothetical protein
LSSWVCCLMSVPGNSLFVQFSHGCLEIQIYVTLLLHFLNELLRDPIGRLLRREIHLRWNNRLKSQRLENASNTVTQYYMIL